MTTFVRLHLMAGSVTVPAALLDLEWPPPERLWIDRDGIWEATDDDPVSDVLYRRSISVITDEQRERMTHVARVAEYRYGPPDEEEVDP